MSLDLQDRFRGCLLGLAVGDVLGARFEAQSAESIRRRYTTINELIDEQFAELWYTDDTQMTIAVAEALADHGEIIEARLCESFARNYTPERGYGRGARAVLDAMQEGGPYWAVAASYFPGGSYGNGAAMRVAPVGLYFRDDISRLIAQAEKSALPTHLHPLGVEGAQLVAVAVALTSSMEVFDRDVYFAGLLDACRSPEYRAKIEAANHVNSPGTLAKLGNGIEALESAATAIASFALTPESYPETIGNVIFLGGDTDTMAAMAGAISGAFLGMSAIPQILLNNLEVSPKGSAYLLELADRLHARCHESGAASRGEA